MEETVDLRKYIGSKIMVRKNTTIFSKIFRLYKSGSYIGVVLDVDDSNVKIYDKGQNKDYQFYYIDSNDFINKVINKNFKVSKMPLSLKERITLNRYLEISEKIKQFNKLCVDWDYRNIVDMTKPHLQGIDILNDSIEFNCEMYSTKLEDYVYCNAGKVDSKSLVNRFKNLNLENEKDVLDFIDTIEYIIDWDRVREDLLSDEEIELYSMQEQKESAQSEQDDYYSKGPDKIPSKKLGEGWFWKKYDDGSGYLESPDGKEYMSYDLATNEYKETRDSSYIFFPLDYYYLDGFNPKDFDPFDYMESEMINIVLPREENMKEDISL